MHTHFVKYGSFCESIKHCVTHMPNFAWVRLQVHCFELVLFTSSFQGADWETAFRDKVQAFSLKVSETHDTSWWPDGVDDAFRTALKRFATVETSHGLVFEMTTCEENRIVQCEVTPLPPDLTKLQLNVTEVVLALNQASRSLACLTGLEHLHMECSRFANLDKLGGCRDT